MYATSEPKFEVSFPWTLKHYFIKIFEFLKLQEKSRKHRKNADTSKNSTAVIVRKY